MIETNQFIDGVNLTDKTSLIQANNNFIDELKSSNICEQLQDHVDSNPQDNYELFHRLLQNAKDKHLPKKRVRYDKKKHKSSKWMTNGI